MTDTIAPSSYSSKTPIDADKVFGFNSEDGDKPIQSTRTAIKSFLKTYFDTLYPANTGSAIRTLLGITTLSGDNTGDNATNTQYSGLASSKLDKAGGTMTGKVTGAGKDEVGKTYTPATGSQTVALDCLVNNIHIVTGHDDGTAITFTIANITNSQCIIVSILQGATTPSTIAGRFATIRRAGGIAPTLTATVGKRDTFGFIRTGADTYDGFIIGQNC